jgi:hypothetical protein
MLAYGCTYSHLQKSGTRLVKALWKPSYLAHLARLQRLKQVEITTLTSLSPMPREPEISSLTHLKQMPNELIIPTMMGFEEVGMMQPPQPPNQHLSMMSRQPLHSSENSQPITDPEYGNWSAGQFF